MLTRVASLFRRLNINIISLTVGRSERAGLSPHDAGLPRPPPRPATASAPACLNWKMSSTWTTLPRRPRSRANWRSSRWPHRRKERSQIFDLVEVFRARIVDLTSESLMIEMTGVESKIEGLIEVLREDEGRILEICRSGKMTMRRGHHTSGVAASHGHRRGRARRRSLREDNAAVELGVTPSARSVRINF